MHYLIPAVFAIVAFSSQANAASSLEAGFDGALRGCEEWLLNPASWTHGSGPFVKTVGLGNRMVLVGSVDELNLPPKQMRQGLHYWRINATPTAGYVLVVSDKLPMCHITGGGGNDLQPTVQRVLSSKAFTDRWEVQKTNSEGEMITTLFRNRHDPALSMVVSRARLPDQRLDRVQVIATATYNVSN